MTTRAYYKYQGLLIILAAVIAALFLPLSVRAETPADVYNLAGEHYREGNFEEALALYESLAESGISDPDLFYNAGNAAYRNEDIGKAILYLERARKLAPSDEDILSNIAFINTVKQDREPEETNAVTAFLTRRYESINSNSAAWWSGIAFAVMGLLLTGALFVCSWKRLILMSLALCAVIVFAGSTGVFIHKTVVAGSIVEAVILQSEVPAFSGPNAENTHIFTIHEGTKVTVVRNQEEWSLIKLSSGAGGWVRSDSFERI